jgi:hypothetical protein
LRLEILKPAIVIAARWQLAFQPIEHATNIEGTFSDDYMRFHRLLFLALACAARRVVNAAPTAIERALALE